jgi:tetratricopeptide (TPR) repeat protein
MSTNPNKLSQFWQELKRRKVIKVIAMYAGTAYILIELVNNVAQPLNLPEWTPRLAILLVVIGFPIAAIVSWIFDVTPEGIKKTEPIEASIKEESPLKKSRRKLKVSDGIIAALFVAVCILLYPKVFNKDKFIDLKDTDGRISIAVMPFQNMTGDSIWDIWQNGIQNELITYLSNSTELSVRQYQTMYDIFQSKEQTYYASLTSSVASDISRKLDVNSFILGSIKESGDLFRINAQLIDSETEEIYKTYQIDGNTEDDFFIIIDSLSKLIKSYLEIEVLKKDLDYDLGEFSSTGSPEAYRLYIRGMNLFFATDLSSAIELFNKALKIDTNLIAARVFLTFSYSGIGMNEKAKICFQRAYKELENLSYDKQLMLKFTKSFLDKDPYTSIKYIGLLLEDDPQRRTMWYLQGMNYMYIYQYEKAIQCFEKALKIDKKWGVVWKWAPLYGLSGMAYHELGNHDREKEIYELGLGALPDQPGIIYRQAICTLSQGDTAEANDYIAKGRSIGEIRNWGEYRINSWIGRIYQEAKQFSKAVDIFRDLIVKAPQDPWSKWQLGFILIDNEINVDEGMEFIKQALEIEPDNYTFLATKGWGLYKQEQLEEALEILKKSWEARPTYEHNSYLHIQEVEQALASQNN